MALAFDSSRLHFLIIVAWADVMRCIGDSNAAAKRSAVPNPTPGNV